ncbi:unnamed protein product [Prorocentrum cordatum]|uniref:Uncharacterized protein n=1 Tax=Prorocentrum cordatum TaxID=2364126 RepID=A0ABN9TSQ3_9DINO|nr:unnamed protein product [Polarella glacialis]
MREKLGLQEGEPEGGQCMLLSTAASSLWRQHGTPPHQKEVHALATRYRAELLEAAGDAPPASSSPLDDALRAGAAVPHSGRDYREFPLLGGPALTSVDLHREEAGGGVKRMGGGSGEEAPEPIQKTTTWHSEIATKVTTPLRCTLEELLHGACREASINRMALDKRDRLGRRGQLLGSRLQAVSPGQLGQIPAHIRHVVRLGKAAELINLLILDLPVAQLDRVCQHEGPARGKDARDLSNDVVLCFGGHLVEKVHGQDDVEAGVFEGQALGVGLDKARLPNVPLGCEVVHPVSVVLPRLLQIERAEIRRRHVHAGPVVPDEGHQPPCATCNFQEPHSFPTTVGHDIVQMI